MIVDGLPRPPRVQFIQRLLWSTAGLGCIGLGLDLATAAVSAGDWLHRGLMALHIAFLVLIARAIGSGKTWGRVAYILPTLLGLNPILLFLPEAEPGRNLVSAGLASVMIVAQTVAFFLLFTRPVSAWFKLHAPAAAAKPWRPGIEGEVSSGPDHTANY